MEGVNPNKLIIQELDKKCLVRASFGLLVCSDLIRSQPLNPGGILFCLNLFTTAAIRALMPDSQLSAKSETVFKDLLLKPLQIKKIRIRIRTSTDSDLLLLPCSSRAPLRKVPFHPFQSPSMAIPWCAGRNQRSIWSRLLMNRGPNRSGSRMILIRQPPDQSGSRLILIRQPPDQSGSLLINQAAAWFWSGSRLINQAASWFWSGSPLISGSLKSGSAWFSNFHCSCS